MKPLIQYIMEGSKTVKNTKLRKMLDKAGYPDIELVKGDGYFYVYSNDFGSEHEKWLRNVDTDIFVNSFNQQSVEQWFDDIMSIINKGKIENN